MVDFKELYNPKKGHHDAILTVMSYKFGFNKEAAESNKFMGEATVETPHKARAEQQLFYDTLDEANVLRITVAGMPETLDDVFPNNWFSIDYDKDGKMALTLFPMANETRRSEKRVDVIAALTEYVVSQGGYIWEDLNNEENNNKFLEGTGSLVLDRENRVVYATESIRTNLELAEKWAEKHGYELVSGKTKEIDGTPIYHTNVLMACGSNMAVLCEDVLADDKTAARFRQSLEESGKEVLVISIDQMKEMAGNAFEMVTSDGQIVFEISDRAWNVLDASQKEMVKKNHDLIIHPPIPEIERVGGGSIRCMSGKIPVPNQEAALKLNKALEHHLKTQLIKDPNVDLHQLAILDARDLGKKISAEEVKSIKSQHINNPYIEKGIRSV